MIFFCETKVASFTTVFICHSAIDYLRLGTILLFFFQFLHVLKKLSWFCDFRVWANCDSPCGFWTFHWSTQYSAYRHHFNILSRDIINYVFNQTITTSTWRAEITIPAYSDWNQGYYIARTRTDKEIIKRAL